MPTRCSIICGRAHVGALEQVLTCQEGAVALATREWLRHLSCAPLHRLEDEDRDQPISSSPGSGGRAGTRTRRAPRLARGACPVTSAALHRLLGLAALDRGPRIGTQVVNPARMVLLAAIRADDDDRLAVLVAEQLDRALLAAVSAGGGQGDSHSVRLSRRTGRGCGRTRPSPRRSAVPRGRIGRCPRSRPRAARRERNG